MDMDVPHRGLTGPPAAWLETGSYDPGCVETCESGIVFRVIGGVDESL